MLENVVVTLFLTPSYGPPKNVEFREFRTLRAAAKFVKPREIPQFLSAERHERVLRSAKTGHVGPNSGRSSGWDGALRHFRQVQGGQFDKLTVSKLRTGTKSRSDLQRPLLMAE
jgi:hypothetical protein